MEKRFHIPRIPGDTIVYPMIIGVILNSFFPSVLQMGSFFTGIVGGTSALVGAFLFFLGASIDVRSTPKAIKKGAVIIITTAYDDFNIAHKAIKLKVDDFLLKPIRKEVLLESVKAFAGRLGEGPQTDKSNKLLSKLEVELRKCSYKATVDLLREYIDQLYLEHHDVNVISKRLQDLAKMIVRTAEELNISDTNELVMQMEKLKIKYLLYNNKHDAYNEVVKMVDILFDKMNIKGKLSDGGFAGGRSRKVRSWNWRAPRT